MDGDIKVEASRIEGDADTDQSFLKAFYLKLQGSYDFIEKLRIPITAHMKQQNLDYIYILTDEVSEKIAAQIYPHINRVENNLRKYLIRFLVTKLGPNWWNVTADSEMKKKIIQRKKNETVFSEYADSKAYLIDFKELGKIVFSQSSGFITKDDIIRKVMSMDETPEAIITLKQQIQSNYNKFFKETFKDKEFQEKWELMEKLRHKVAHSNLFTADDLNEAKRLASELTEIIGNANDQIDKVTFTVDEKVALKESVVESSQAYEVITQDVFLSELKDQEQYFVMKGGYVGLSQFVKGYLGGKGYDPRSSFELAYRLKQKGVVENYEVEDGKYGKVLAIKLFNPEDV